MIPAKDGIGTPGFIMASRPSSCSPVSRPLERLTEPHDIVRPAPTDSLGRIFQATVGCTVYAASETDWFRVAPGQFSVQLMLLP